MLKVLLVLEQQTRLELLWRQQLRINSKRVEILLKLKFQASKYIREP